MQLHLEDKFLLTISSRGGAEATLTQPPVCLEPFRTETGLAVPLTHGDVQVVPLLRTLSQQPSHFSYIKLLNMINSFSKITLLEPSAYARDSRSC